MVARSGSGGGFFHPRFIEGEVRVIGERHSPPVHQLKDFLARSRIAYRWLDLEQHPGARRLAERAIAGVPQYPVVLFPDGTALANPDVRAVAEQLGLDTEPDNRVYDLVVVGGGPAGLSAAIYAASEGLHTVVVEQEAPGGQAGCSPHIENYPGFPDGVSGGELARRTTRQAERFGVEIVVTRRAVSLRGDGADRVVVLEDGEELWARAVLLAMGVSFRWLDAPGCAALVGAGVYYGAATAEASACRDQEVFILGGGNSAGQSALLLARFARRVTILTIEDSIEETMSQYLVDQLRHAGNVMIRTSHTVTSTEGSGHLERLTIEDIRSGRTETVHADSLFVFIGASPRTDWLGDTVARDEEGFILCGTEALAARSGSGPDRRADPLETSMPGVFVAGDVRKGSVKRLTAAAGEGAMAVAHIHRHCRERAGAGREA